MKNNPMKYIIFLLLMLSTCLSAQHHSTLSQNGKEVRDIYPAKFEVEYLIGEFDSVEVYLYNENDLMSRSSMDSIVWYSHPTSYIFIKKENVKSYAFESELSFAIYDLLCFAEDCGTKDAVEKVKSLIAILIQRHNDVKDIRYECTNGDKYGYWIYYWLHFYKLHDYGYWPPAAQNIQYRPVNILGLHPISHGGYWNENILKWQQITYGKTSSSFRLYNLSRNGKYFLLESVFEDNSIRYDLVLKDEEEKEKLCFYLAMNSFSALLSEFYRLYNMDVSFDILKTLSLIDMFYKDFGDY